MFLKTFKRVLLASAVTITALSFSAMAYDVQGGTVVTGSAVNVRSGPSTSDAVLDKLYDGTRVAVIDSTDGWYKIALDGTTGFMSADYLTTQPIMNIEAGGAKVTTAVLNMRSKPTTDSDVITRLSEGSVAKIIGINAGWLKVTASGCTGYIHPDYAQIVKYSGTSGASTKSSSNGSSNEAAAAAYSPDSPLRQQVVDYAKSFLGVKYVYGGSSPKGFDCSGFTQYVYKNFGISIRRNSAAQYSSSVTKIKKSALQTGDLVFFGVNGSKNIGHVGIYLGGGQFIHASSPGDYVKIDSMNSGYYSSNYKGAGTLF